MVRLKRVVINGFVLTAVVAHGVAPVRHEEYVHPHTHQEGHDPLNSVGRGSITYVTSATTSATFSGFGSSS
jgi:hypothetical protein